MDWFIYPFEECCKVLFLLYSWRNQGPEKLRNFPKVTQLGNSEIQIEIKLGNSEIQIEILTTLTTFDLNSLNS